MQNLKVVAVASSEQVRTALYSQFQELGFIDFDGVVLELGDAVRKCQQQHPDIIIIDLTGRKEDAELFMKTISMDPDHPSTIFAMHSDLDHSVIVDAVQAGAKEFIQYPDESEKLEIALRKYLSMINRGKESPESSDSSQAKLVSLFSAKGGAGCTTVASNLACELARKSDVSVALLDMDQVFSNVATVLNLKPSYSIGDLTVNDSSELDDQVFKRIAVEHNTGLHVFVASKSVLDDHDMISPGLLEMTVNYLIANYDYVLVDLPSHVLDPYHQYLIERSDEILLVSCLDIPGLSRAKQYLELAKQFLDMSKVKLILNRHTQKAAYGMTNESVEEQFAYPVYARLPNDWEINVEANSLGVTFAEVKASSELSKSVSALAELVLGKFTVLDAAEDNEKEAFSGVLGKLFSGMKKSEK